MKKNLHYCFLFFFLISYSSFGSVTLLMRNHYAAPATQVTVPVKVKDFINIISVQGTIQFDQTITSFVSVQDFGLTGLNASNFGTSQTASGKLTFSWFDASLSGITLPDTAVIFSVKYNAIGSLGQVSPLLFVNTPTLMEAVNNSFTAETLVLENGAVYIQNTTSAASLTLQMDTISGTQGSQVVVALRAIDFTNINSTQGTIQFDPAVVSYGGIGTYGLPGMSASNFGSTQIASGKLNFSWLDNTLSGQDMADNAPLFTMIFNLTGNTGSQTSLSFATAPTPLEITDSLMNALTANVVNGNIRITGTPASQTLTIRIDTVSGPNASQVIVPVRAWQFNKVMSMQGTISFNTSVATFASVEQFGLPSMDAGSFGTSQVNSGKLMFSWLDPTLSGVNLTDSSVLFAIRYNVVGLPGDTTSLDFINAPTPLEFIDTSNNPISATLESGKIRVSGAVTITTNNPTSFTYCSGDSVSVSYSALGAFNGGNNFILQVSDTNGSFTSATAIDTISSTSLSGSLNTVIPISLSTGSAYRFRIVSTNPVITGTDNGTAISIYQTPAAPSQPAGDSLLCLNPLNSTYTTSAVAAATSYSWSITPSSAGTLTPSGTSVVVDWANTFTGTVSLNVTATNGSCTGLTSTDLIVTINAVPSLAGTPAGPTTLCSNSSNSTYTTTGASDATSYSWSISPSTAGTITGTATTAIVDWDSAYSGTVTINVTGINGVCTGIPSADISVDITATPSKAGTPAGTTALCINPATTSYSTTGASDATSYNWTLTPSSAGTIIGSGTNISIDWNDTFTGTAAINVTGINGICTGPISDSLMVIVNAIPGSATTPTGNTNVCQGATGISYSTAGISNASSYYWSIIPANAGTINGSDTSVTIDWSTSYFGSASINVTGVNGVCLGLTSGDLVVTINQADVTPTVSNTSGTACLGDTVYLHADSISNAGYSWTGPNGFNSNQQDTYVVLNDPGSAGDYTVNVSVNGCVSVNAGVTTIIINYSQTPVTSNSGPVCEGNDLSVSADNIGNATYSWTGPNGFSSSLQNITLNAVTTNDSGMYILQTSVNGCLSLPDTTVAIVNPTPATPVISGSDTVCIGSDLTLNTSAINNATYLWSNVNGFSSNLQNPTISAVSFSDSGFYSVTVFENGCASSADSLFVTVKDIPATPSVISGNTSVCDGSSNVYSIAAVNDVTSYSWTLPGAWTGSSTTNNITTTASTTGGNITVAAINSCGTSAIQTLAVTLSNTLATPDSISGNVSVCDGSSNTYTIAAVSGATSYSWTLPNGWTGTSTGNSITTTANVNSGDISVIAMNACSSSAQQTVSVSVNSVPATPAIISGNTTICEGSSNTYSITAVSAASSYSWTLPNGWTGASTTNSITTTASADSGDISVMAANSCGVSSAQSLAVTVNSTPVLSGISGSASVCIGSANTYSVSSTGGASFYSWTLPSGWTGNSATSSITTTASATSGTITVTANNSCGTSIVENLPVTVNNLPATPTITAGGVTGNLCPGSTVTLTSSAASGYSWSGGETTQAITVTTAGSYQVTITDVNGCSSTSAATTVSYSSTLNLPLTENFESTTFPSTDWSIGNPNANDTWTRSTAASGFGIGSASTRMDNFTNNISGQSDYLYTPTLSLSGTGSASLKFDVAHARYSATYVDTLEVLISTNCGSTWTSLYRKEGTNLATAADATSLFVPTSTQWRTETIDLASYLNIPAVKIAFRNGSGYGNTIYLDNINLTGVAAVVANFTASATTVCAGQSVTFTDQTSNSPTTWSWTFAGGTPANSTAQNPTVTYNSPGTYSVTLTANNGTTPNSITKTGYITVNALPTVTASASPASICAGTSSTLTGGGAASYSWSNGQTTASTSVSPSATTTYTVTGTSNGCSKTTTTTVTVNTLPNVTTSASPATLCDGGNSTLTASGASSYNWSTGASGAALTVNISATQTYSVTGTAANGCSATASQTVTVISSPATPNISDVSGTLYSSEASGNQWYNSNGPIAGATGSSYTPTVTGDYYTVVTQNGCSSIASNTINVIITGLDQLNSTGSLSVFPNPSNGKLSVEGLIKDTRALIQIYGSSGNLIYETESHCTNGVLKEEIVLNTISNGVYTIKVTSGSSHNLRLLIVK